MIRGLLVGRWRERVLFVTDDQGAGQCGGPVAIDQQQVHHIAGMVGASGQSSACRGERLLLAEPYVPPDRLPVFVAEADVQVTRPARRPANPVLDIACEGLPHAPALCIRSTKGIFALSSR